ncbi:hypothetical protein PG996_002843 [Apiospora saccharicola]|uniref:F-box domain-containing protein n=1 Tax=Apiospora saccharicola TaxID=335842 RepID=A0ABR1WKN3_9PEZI
MCPLDDIYASDDSEEATEEPTDEAILRLCSSSQWENASSLVQLSSSSEDFEKTKAVQGSLRTAFSSHPTTASLGDLDRFPHEIVAMIVPHLDVLSYFHFRHLNRLARQLCTEFVKEYQVIVKHGLGALRGLLRGNLVHRCTIWDLYCVMTNRDCELCGAFGGFIYLPSALRCCYPCIWWPADELLVLDRATFCGQAGVSLAEAEHILVGSTLRTVPGPYDKSNRWDNPIYDRPEYLISAKEALEEMAAREMIRQPISLSKLASDHKESATQFMASTALPWYNPRTSKADGGVCCEGEIGGYDCKPCPPNSVERVRAYRSFPTEEFVSHAMGCDAARNYWAESKRCVQDTKHMKYF